LAYLITKFVFIFKPLSYSSGKRSAIFHTRAWFHLHMSRILSPAKTHLEHTTNEQTTTYRQLHSHIVGSRLMKRNGKIHWMIKLISCKIHSKFTDLRTNLNSAQKPFWLNTCRALNWVQNYIISRPKIIVKHCVHSVASV